MWEEQLNAKSQIITDAITAVINKIPMMPTVMDPIMQGTTHQLRDFHAAAEQKLQGAFQADEANIVTTFARHENMTAQHEQILGDIKKQAAEMQDVMTAIAAKMGIAGAELDDRHVNITSALQALSDKIARTEQDLATMAGSMPSGGGAGYARNKVDRFNNPKEASVKVLPESLTRADFSFWVDLYPIACGTSRHRASAVSRGSK